MSISRKLAKGNIEIEVIEHVVLSNGWEYFMFEPFDDDGIGMALVKGFETEMGSVAKDDVSCYGVSRTTNLDEVVPPEGWKWAEHPATCFCHMCLH